MFIPDEKKSKQDMEEKYYLQGDKSPCARNMLHVWREKVCVCERDREGDRETHTERGRERQSVCERETERQIGTRTHTRAHTHSTRNILTCPWCLLLTHGNHTHTHTRTHTHTHTHT